MKVLYINNYYDGTGWAKQGIDSILALDAAGVDVVPRAIKLNGLTTEVPQKIKELESKSDKNPDVVIQNVLPPFARYFHNAGKNIIYYQTETGSFKTVGWADEINMMDEAWVFCTYGKKAAINSEVKIPIEIVPMPVDLNKFNITYEKSSLNIRHEIGDDAFVFYTVSEFTNRKNIETLLRAYHSEFAPDEQVHLLIKTTDAGYGPDIQKHIFDTLDKVKRNLRIHKDLSRYKKELIVCGHISQEDLYFIHNTCNAFVTASHGEGWCMPCFDAMGFGKTIVAPRHSAFTDYLSDKNAYLVDCYEDNCYGATDTIPGLYSANDTWFEVPVKNLRRAMRDAYEQRKAFGAARRAEQAKVDIRKFSYKNVGNIMKDLLKG